MDYLRDFTINGKRSLINAECNVKHLAGFFGAEVKAPPRLNASNAPAGSVSSTLPRPK